MENIKDFFGESPEGFLVYVVEQRFAVGRGYAYFKSFKGTSNYIESNQQANMRIRRILQWINKNIPHVSKLIDTLFSSSVTSQVGLAGIIMSLSKLFSVHEHQAAGPEVIDPIIIQEGKVNKKNLTQIITLHKTSILQPVIIILLQDNDFVRAKKILSECPHGTSIKLIRNSGETELYRAINTGAMDIDSFIDSYARQCFSTCSNTTKNILMNEDWIKNNVVKRFSPNLLKVRSSLLKNHKKYVLDDINSLIAEIENTECSFYDKRLMNSFECMAKLSRVYCNDNGGKDIKDAWNIAKEVDNDVLKAHVYRYAFFLDQYSENEKIELLTKAEGIFKNNNIYDHSIYCKNNRLIQQFYTDRINSIDFRHMQEESIHNIPGLVGMSYILNNTGVAYLYNADPDSAMKYFIKGLDYTKDHIVQKLGLMINILITKDYAYQSIEEKEIRNIIRRTFDSMLIRDLPFIAANYILNALIISEKHVPDLAHTLIQEYPIYELLLKASDKHLMGSKTLSKQIGYLDDRLGHSPFQNLELSSCSTSTENTRYKFIDSNGCNPIIFHVWL